MTNLYYIENVGCDDTTHGLARMTDEEFAVFKRVVENLNKKLDVWLYAYYCGIQDKRLFYSTGYRQ